MYRPPPALALLALVLAGCAADGHGDVPRAQAPAPWRASEAAAPSEEVWITTQRDVLPWVRWLLGATPPLHVATGTDAATLMALRVPAEVLPELSEIAHEERHHCGGYVLHESEAEARASLADPLAKDALLQRAPARYSVDNGVAVMALTQALRDASLLATLRALAAYRTRFHESSGGQEAARFIEQRWRALSAGRDDSEVTLIDHQKTPQPSVALTIRGSTLPDEYVILGGHMDSIVGRGSATSAAPGADDNASGIATLTEIARALFAVDFRPARSVIFYAYAAEEVGLIGSTEIATLARDEARQVVGVMQLDMTNYTSARDPYITLIRDFTDAALNALSIQLIETYLKLPWKYDDCGYACSDHAAWTAKGFAATFPHEATLADGNRRIHTLDDTLAQSRDGVTHAMRFARFGAAFLAELAKGTAADPARGCGDAPPCHDTERCVAGACVPASNREPLPVACGPSQRCAVGLTCVAGTCEDPTAARDRRDAGGLDPAASTRQRDAGRPRASNTRELDEETGSVRDDAAHGCGVAHPHARPDAGLTLLALGLWLRGRRRRA